jgi:hypothetical protein
MLKEMGTGWAVVTAKVMGSEKDWVSVRDQETVMTSVKASVKLKGLDLVTGRASDCCSGSADRSA